MSQSTSLRIGRHVAFELHAHLVFVTKYRKNIMTKPILKFLHQVFQDICKKFDTTLTQFEGETDHVHLLIHFPPKIALSKLVNSLKGVSSRLLRTTFQKQISQYYWKNVFWSPSYFISSCGGAPLETIKKYIQNQQKPFA